MVIFCLQNIQCEEYGIPLNILNLKWYLCVFINPHTLTKNNFLLVLDHIMLSGKVELSLSEVSMLEEQFSFSPHSEKVCVYICIHINRYTYTHKYIHIKKIYIYIFFKPHPFLGLTVEWKYLLLDIKKPSYLPSPSPSCFLCLLIEF